METITRRVIKRNGEEVVFDVQKILNAIRKANNEVEPIHRLNEYQIEAVGKIVMDSDLSVKPCYSSRRYSGYGRTWHYGDAWI
ncbi:MAG: ATP cone domain-containing protein [Eubacterium ventriosum]